MMGLTVVNDFPIPSANSELDLYAFHKGLVADRKTLGPVTFTLVQMRL